MGASRSLGSHANSLNNGLGLFLRLGGLIALKRFLCFCGSIDQYARYRECWLALDLLVVLNRFLQGHFIDQGRNVLLLCQLAGSAAAIPVYKFVSTVLAQSEDNSSLTPLTWMLVISPP